MLLRKVHRIDGFFVLSRSRNVTSISHARRLSGLDQLVSRHARRRRDLLAETSNRDRCIGALAVAACARLRTSGPNPQAVLLVFEPGDLSRVANEVGTLLGDRGTKRGAPRSVVEAVCLRPDSDGRKDESALARSPAIVISTPARLIDHIRRENVDLGGVSTVAVMIPGASEVEQFSADLHFIYAKFSRRPATIALTADLGQELDLLEDLLVRPRTIEERSIPQTETPTPRVNREDKSMRELPFDPAEIKSRVAEIVRSIHEDEDPFELTQYRKWVRKNTSIFNRGYILAYLLKYAGGKPTVGSRGSSAERPSRGRKPRKEPVAATAESANGDENHKSIFVSIGRSRRVRSRDLITFFTSADGISQEDIGQVKVLDNYSFVEVSTAKAQAAIDALNGQEFRGRTLTVNYARRK